MSIEVVTQDRMPQLQHMDAQLVGATGDGGQLDQAVAVLHLQFLPQGEGMTPSSKSTFCFGRLGQSTQSGRST